MIPSVVSPLVTFATFAVTAGLLVGASYLKGRQDGREAVLTEQLTASSKLAKRQDRRTEQVRVEYVDRVQVVTQQGKEVVREVERLIPFGLCQLDPGFRLLHDAAAAGAIPGPAGRADGAAAPVEQAAAAHTVAENYLACHLNSEQLTALQRWVTAQKSIYERGK